MLNPLTFTPFQRMKISAGCVVMRGRGTDSPGSVRAHAPSGRDRNLVWRGSRGIEGCGRQHVTRVKRQRLQSL